MVGRPAESLLHAPRDHLWDFDLECSGGTGHIEWNVLHFLDLVDIAFEHDVHGSSVEAQQRAEDHAEAFVDFAVGWRKWWPLGSGIRSVFAQVVSGSGLFDDVRLALDHRKICRLDFADILALSELSHDDCAIFFGHQPSGKAGGTGGCGPHEREGFGTPVWVTDGD